MMEKGKRMDLRICDYRVVESRGSKYVLYKIAVNTASKTWEVERRYTQFKEFRDKMVLRLHEKGIKHTPEFPTKIIFSNFSPVKIEQRRRKLEAFLNELARLIDLPEECEFLCGEDETKTRFSSLQFEVPPAGKQRPHLLSEEIAAIGGRQETGEIYEFLQRINHEPLKIANSVQEFEQYYFETSRQLIKSEIKLLLWGDAKLKGLLHFCGETKKFIASTACMRLLGRLLKYEFNPMCAELIQQVFGRTDPNVVRGMHLDHYIKEITSHDSAGLLALYYYLHNNSYDIGEACDIIEDKESIEEYDKWILNKTACGYLFKDSLQKSASKLSMSDRKSSAEEYELSKETMKEMYTKSLEDVKITKALVGTSCAASAEAVEELVGQLDGYAMWDLMSAFSSSTFEVYSRGKRDFRVTLQLQTDDVKKAARFMYELDKRYSWDRMYWTTLKKEGEYQDVVQVAHPYYGGKAKFHEYILCRNLGKGEDGDSLIIIARSMLLPKSGHPAVKRVQVNACVTKLCERMSIDGGRYVECQILWRLEEGYINLVEYQWCLRGELESRVNQINSLLQ